MAIPAERVPGLHSHPPVSTEVCEWCDQPIAPERLVEVRGRIAARELERSNELAARLREQFGRERAEDTERFQSQLAAQRDEAAAEAESIRAEGFRQATLARSEGQKVAEAAAADRLREVERMRLAGEAQWQERWNELLAEREATERTNGSLKAELARTQAAAEQATQAFAQREADIRAEAQRAGMEEGTRAAAVSLEQARQRADESERQVAQQRLSAQADKEAAVAEVTGRLKSADEQRVEAERVLRQTQQQLQGFKDTQATELQQRLQEQREALVKEKDQSLLEADARFFAERQKLQRTVQDLTRQLEKRSAEERGEGAEINIHDALKGAFEGDKIRRVQKGTAGADIIHEVKRNGQVCGLIVYEVKNRNDYKRAYASKLRADQIAARADFAILASNHFPAGVSQLHVEVDGVIVVCPARVVTLAQILRRHILQLHSQRMSNEAREAKTEALYKYLTSEPCRQLLESVDRAVRTLLELDVAETKAHKAVWTKRGKLLADLLKAHGDLCGTFERIIGTAD